MKLLYLLNVACSAGQSLLSKQYAKNGGDSCVFNINKTVAGIVVFIIWGLIQGFSFHLPTVFFGIGYGISLCVSMNMGFRALAAGPMALTSVVASFSLLIPFFFGVCFWNEPLTFFGVCGIIMLLLSIMLINGKKVGGISFKWSIYAAATLLANGICSIIQKYYQTEFPNLYRTEFMIFALASVLIILFISQNLNHSEKKTFKFSFSGVVSGVLNGAANYIVLFLSATENASVLFPIISAANIVAVWVIGIFFFKEKLAVLQTIGLILGMLSIVLLKL